MEVLENLSKPEVGALRDRFREPLTEEEFEQVFVEYAQRMSHIDCEKLRLHELFNDIDANGDLTVSWDEFIMFMIDSAALEATLSMSGRDAVIRQYRPVTALEDEVPGSIAGIRYIREMNRVIKFVPCDDFYNLPSALFA